MSLSRNSMFLGQRPWCDSDSVPSWREERKDRGRDPEGMQAVHGPDNCCRCSSPSPGGGSAQALGGSAVPSADCAQPSHRRLRSPADTTSRRHLRSGARQADLIRPKSGGGPNSTKCIIIGSFRVALSRAPASHWPQARALNPGRFVLRLAGEPGPCGGSPRSPDGRLSTPDRRVPVPRFAKLRTPKAKQPEIKEVSVSEKCMIKQTPVFSKAKQTAKSHRGDSKAG
jgi:hypothetical protein